MAPPLTPCGPAKARTPTMPSHDPAQSTELEIWFTPSATGTRLVLEHRNWERRGDLAATMRYNCETGWIMVLGRYAERAANTAATPAS